MFNFFCRTFYPVWHAVRKAFFLVTVRVQLHMLETTVQP